MTWAKQKYYLIQLIEAGNVYWLRNNGRSFHWNNHGKDKEYKSLGAARKLVAKLRTKTNGPVNAVEITFRPCNPELPDGYYEPVQRVVK